VPLSPKAVTTLSAQKSAAIQRLDSHLFAVTPHAVTTAFRRAVSRVRRESSDKFCVDLRFHDLRDEAVSRLLERGFNVTEVASISGHRSPQMLYSYCHLSARMLTMKLD
jgi:integrase